MKKQFIIYTLLLASLYTYSQDSQAHWKKNVEVDGVATEWNIPLRFYSNDAKLFFSIANDSTHLFLCFQTSDEKTQMKISRAGMKIGLKAKGKLKCDASIDFPIVGKKERMSHPDVEQSERPSIKEKRNGMMAQNVSLSATGFATQNGILSIKESNGIQAAINWDEEDRMTYELAIPLKELFGATFNLKDVIKALTMSIEVNALTRPESRSHGDGDGAGGAGSMSGGGSGGMGGSGGGMGGGSGRGGMDSRGGTGGGGHGHGQREHSDGDGATDSAFELSKFKQRFLLAQHAGE